MTARWRAAVVVLGVLVAAGGVVWLTTFFGPPPRVEAPPASELAPQARTPTDLAELSCVHARLATQLIQADGDAATARQELAAARALAAEAVRRDGRFASLSGGIAALDEAIRNDDAPAARVALPVALKECEGLSR